MNSLSARLTEAADALSDDLPEGVEVIQNLDGEPTLDQLDLYCVNLMFEASEVLDRSQDHEHSSSALEGAPYGIACIWAKALSDIVLDFRVNHTSKWARDKASMALSAASVDLVVRLSAPSSEAPSRSQDGQGPVRALSAQDALPPLLHEVRAVLEPFARFADGLPHFSGPSQPGRYEYASSVVGERRIMPNEFKAAAALYARLQPPAEKGKENSPSVDESAVQGTTALDPEAQSPAGGGE